ncbi:signal recognition particle-docking protein FtsY [Corynebacterium imitans]|uniref:signal recognition particle-docking protein FtsY n=1 Tax=Corynebacterium imitans TaxID=156978 RepID=UPI00254BEDD4|nr:signal recognition particle-docking protein FtsY [Corynebacterium imitans]MDK8305679.1 signal recognition particle-docking protein FtsY [Corynebacterium imitans]MDK8636855.1 signal recognition particle-docking protein FtsY [Corynebacterium imitans]MDK8773675.1 signal recognition particle-docking protein FtsY [Corynebacterium imitans]
MNSPLLWIVVAIIVVALIVLGIVVVGRKRKEEKTVSFAKTEEPKELTQQEKSGNYQAKGGFNFAPAAAPSTPEKEPVRIDEPREPKPAQEQQAAAPAPEPVVEPEPEPVEKAAKVEDADKVEKAAKVEDAAKVEKADKVEEAAKVERTPEPSTEEPADEVVVNTDAEADTETRETVVTPDEVEPVEEPTETLEPEAPVAEAPAEEPAAEPAHEPEQAPVEEPKADEDQTRQAQEAGAAAAAAAASAEAARAPEAEAADVSEDVVVEKHDEPTEDIEEIEPAAGRIGKLRGRLSRSQNAIGQGLLGILTAGDLDEDAWEDIEDTLIMADLGANLTMRVTETLRGKIAERGVSTEEEARAMLRETLIEAARPEMDRSIKAMPNEGKPAVILVAGVNGTGKTTTTGKLARVLVSMGHSVVLGAADTFRAAAADQLETWGRRVGASTVRGKEGADPASVAFDAVATGVQEGADVVLIDTAGRLHTSTDLMDQLGKVKRVVEKKSNVDEVLLVLDATVGQNGIAQARVFREVVDITGVVLTKLDGTAKGGIVFQVQEELGVPVKLVGLGEGADDLAPFEVESFVDALLG